MNAIGTACSQIGDRLRATSFLTRIALCALLTMSGVALAMLCSQQTSEPDAFLLQGEAIPSGQMAAMEAAFAKAGLSDYQIDARRIKIPRGRQAAYMAALADSGALPVDFGAYTDQALKQANPFTNHLQQEEMIKAARERELSLIVRSMKGIERAAVLYDVQKKPGLQGGQIVTASVNVKPAGNDTLTPDQVESLRNFLAGAIAGLDPTSVTVTDLNSGKTYSRIAENKRHTGKVGSTFDIERGLEDRIRNGLRMIPQVQVTANVPADDARSRHVDRARIDVVVPCSYIEEVFREQQPEEGHPQVSAKSKAAVRSDVVAQVERQVENLLPPDGELTPVRPDVRVIVSPNVTSKPTAPPRDAMAVSLEWASRNRNSLMVTGLAVVSFLSLVTIVRPVRNTRSIHTSSLRDSLEPSDAADYISPARHARVDQAPAPIPSQEPTTEASDDALPQVDRISPDAAVRVLRDWIAKAS